MHNGNSHRILHPSPTVNGYSVISSQKRDGRGEQRRQWRNLEKKICTSVEKCWNLEHLDRRYVGEGETLVTLVSIVSNPRVIETRNKQESSQQREKHPWIFSRTEHKFTFELGQNCSKNTKQKRKVPWARSPPTRLLAMKVPTMIPSMPKTRRETARAISLTGGRLLTVNGESIIMSSSVIENAWSTYAIFLCNYRRSRFWRKKKVLKLRSAEEECRIWWRRRRRRWRRWWNFDFWSKEKLCGCFWLWGGVKIKAKTSTSAKGK